MHGRLSALNAAADTSLCSQAWLYQQHNDKVVPQTNLGTISLDSKKIWIATEAGPNRIALYEWFNDKGNTIVRLKGAVAPPGYKQKEFKLGYVWKK